MAESSPIRFSFPFSVNFRAPSSGSRNDRLVTIHVIDRASKVPNLESSGWRRGSPKVGVVVAPPPAPDTKNALRYVDVNLEPRE